MRKHLIAAIIALTFNLNYSQYNNYSQPKEFIISGIVSSLDNDELLEYATITLLNTENNDVITGGISDNFGKFSIPTKPGKYNILIEYISFKNLTMNGVEINNNLDLGKLKLEIDYESLGEVEIIAEELEILNPSLPLPFQLDEYSSVGEEARLKYRFLDLRRADMQHNLRLRSVVSSSLRDYLDSNGFLEIETPILTKATPEGARDYLVPSRTFPGSFFALPQSPQLFKQTLIASGFEKYYQFANALEMKI